MLRPLLLLPEAADEVPRVVVVSGVVIPADEVVEAELPHYLVAPAFHLPWTFTRVSYPLTLVRRGRHGVHTTVRGTGRRSRFSAESALLPKSGVVRRPRVIACCVSLRDLSMACATTRSAGTAHCSKWSLLATRKASLHMQWPP